MRALCRLWAGAAEGYAGKTMNPNDDLGKAAGRPSHFIGRVECRSAGTIRLVGTGNLVRAKDCPCENGKLVLLQQRGEDYWPVLWET